MISNIRQPEKYECLIFNRDIQKDQLIVALDEVRKYIVEKKLILTGGMAIDLAVRKKGYKLYEDEALPDYDFYSHDFQNDAYKIGKKLCKLKLDNISVITATHPTTMRVRVNFVPVADVTYIPKHLYKKIPTIKYKDGMLIEHPHYKMINIHTSLSYPYANSPYDVILDRFDKDICRYDLLYTAYPIEETNFEPKLINVKINKKILNDNCLTGFAALYYWNNLYEKESVFPQEITLKLPSETVSIISDDPYKTLDIITKLYTGVSSQPYNALLDNIPGKISVYSKNKHIFDILDNRGSLTAAYKLGNIWIANLQVVMSQLLSKYYMYDSVDRKKYLWGYKQCFKLVQDATNTYTKNISKASIKNTENLLPTYQTYGKFNINKSNISREHFILEKIGQMSKRVYSDRPLNVYPTLNNDCDISNNTKKFVIDKSWLFENDGLKRNIPLKFICE
jgi:Poly(A) polymerase catalytic subunit